MYIVIGIYLVMSLGVWWFMRNRIFTERDVEDEGFSILCGIFSPVIIFVYLFFEAKMWYHRKKEERKKDV